MHDTRGMIEIHDPCVVTVLVVWFCVLDTMNLYQAASYDLLFDSNTASPGISNQ